MLVTRENRDLAVFTQEPLLTVSRLVRYEALYIFLNVCKIRVLYLPDLVPFLDFIGPYCCSALRHLTIADTFFPTMWHSDVILQTVRWLNELPQLKELTLNMCIEEMVNLRCKRRNIDSYDIPSIETFLQLPSMNALLQLRGSMKIKLMYDFEPTLDAWTAEYTRSMKLDRWPQHMLVELGEFFQKVEKGIMEAAMKSYEAEFTREQIPNEIPGRQEDSSEGELALIEESTFGEGSDIEMEDDEDYDDLLEAATLSENHGEEKL
jgi:hypothetical protein